jgi:hypothetical protein
LKLDTEIAHNLLAILLDTIVQRDEKIAYEGIATLEKYLRMHIDQCEKCCSTDCTHMQDIQNKFIDMNDLRIKIKSPLMVNRLILKPFNFIILDLLYELFQRMETQSRPA